MCGKCNEKIKEDYIELRKICYHIRCFGMMVKQVERELEDFNNATIVRYNTKSVL